MADDNLARIKRNVAKMAAKGGPVQDIDGYIQSEGATKEAIKNYKLSTDDKHSVLGDLVATLNTGNAAARTALKGATGGVVTNVIPSEIAAPVIWAAKNLFTDEKVSYGDARKFAHEVANRDTNEFKEEHPVLSPVLEIGGAVVTAGTAAKLIGNAANAASKVPVIADIVGAGAKTANAISKVPGGKTALQVGKSAATVGTAAGAYGAGTNEEGDYAEGFADYAPVGAGIGAGLGVTGPGIAALAKKLKKPAAEVEKIVVQNFKNKAEKFFASQLAKRPDLKEALAKAETLDQAAKAMGIKLTTAEKLAYAGTDPLLAQQGVISGNPNTGARMADFYKNRSGEIENAYENVAAKVHPAQTYDEAADAVVKAADQGVKRITKELVDEASPLYDEAYKGNQSVKSPLLDKILDTPEGKSAFKYAVKSMQNQLSRVAVPDKELAEAAKDLVMVGKVSGKKIKDGVASGLKLRTLDLVKRGFDDAINDAKAASAPGTTSQKARDLISLRKAFVDELDNLDVTKNIPAGRDAATGRLTKASVNPEGGAYARARKVYSGQPEKLALRERGGNISDVNPDAPQSVAKELMKGTQATAEKSAKALGPEGKKAAGAAVIREAIETNRGAPEALVKKLAPNDRTAEQLASYLEPEAAKALDTLNELAGRVSMGNRLIKSPSPTQERTAAEKLLEGASKAGDLVSDIATGGKLTVVKKLAKLFGVGAKEENPEFYEDMYRLMTTDEGLELAKRIAFAQEKAIQQAALKGGKNVKLPASAGSTGGVLTESMKSQKELKK